MLESLLLLGVGCATGTLFGLLGQPLLDRALSVELTDVDSGAREPRARTAAALAIVTLPCAAKIPAALALAD